MQPQACWCGLPMLWGGNTGHFMETKQEPRVSLAMLAERAKEVMERSGLSDSMRKTQEIMEQSGLSASMRKTQEVMEQSGVAAAMLQNLQYLQYQGYDIFLKIKGEHNERMREIIELARNKTRENLDLWRRDFGSIPPWLERRQPNIARPPLPEEESSAEVIDCVVVPAIPPVPLGSDAVRLIREDDEKGLRQALARINARKSAQVFDARTVALYEDFIASGLSKTGFAKRNHKKHHIGYATCRKKLQGIEEKVEGIKKK